MEQHPDKLQWRSSSVGGLSASQFGSALGYCGRVSDFVTYQREHVGTVLEFTGNAATEHGCRTESKARCCYNLATGLEVVNGGFFTSHDRELACSPDGIVIVPGLSSAAEQKRRPIRLLEIKSPYRALFDGSKESNQPHGIPVQYMCQMQGQMSLSGATECDFHIYLDGPQDCQVMCWRVYRDKGFWDWCEAKLRTVSRWIANGLPEGVNRSFQFEPFDYAKLRVESLLPPFSITTQRVMIDPKRYPFFFSGRRPPANNASSSAAPTPTTIWARQPRAHAVKTTLLSRRGGSCSSSQPPSAAAAISPSCTPVLDNCCCGCGYCLPLSNLKSPAAQIFFATSLDRALQWVPHDNSRDAASIAMLLAAPNSPAVNLAGSIVEYDGNEFAVEHINWDEGLIHMVAPARAEAGSGLSNGCGGSSADIVTEGVRSVAFSDTVSMLKFSRCVKIPAAASPISGHVAMTSGGLPIPVRVPGRGGGVIDAAPAHHPVVRLSFTTAAALIASTSAPTGMICRGGPPHYSAMVAPTEETYAVDACSSTAVRAEKINVRATVTISETEPAASLPLAVGGTEKHPQIHHQAPSTSPHPHLGIRMLMGLLTTRRGGAEGSGGGCDVQIAADVRRILFLPTLTFAPLAFRLEREGGGDETDPISVFAFADGISQYVSSSQQRDGLANPFSSRRDPSAPFVTLVCCPLDTLLYLVDLCEGRDASTAVVVSDSDDDKGDTTSLQSSSTSLLSRTGSSTLLRTASGSGGLSGSDFSQKVRESLMRKKHTAAKHKATAAAAAGVVGPPTASATSLDEGAVHPSVAAIGRSLASRDGRFVFCAVSLQEPTEELRRRWVAGAPPQVMHVRMSWPAFYRVMAKELKLGAEGVSRLISGSAPPPLNR